MGNYAILVFWFRVSTFCPFWFYMEGLLDNQREITSTSSDCLYHLYII